jgi:hypothetical protein
MIRRMPHPRKPNTLLRIFRWPMALALITIAGLLSALVGDGWADAASWLLLGTLVVVIMVTLRPGG